GKQPYLIGLKGEEPFAFAGLWERWQGRDEAVIESFTIIVTEANELLRPIHERMPVILDPSDYDLWLEGGPEAAPKARELLRPYPAEQMAAYAVSRRVNNPRYDDPECIAPLRETGAPA
ncbi:MAG: SOS response-associated peptidase, partial [Alphaproteobacteria bacterium]